MKYTTESFIQEAKRIYGDKFDYSKTIYINWKTKVCIICPIHGEFWQIPYNHLKGNGCPKCNYEKLSDKMAMSIQEFIERARRIHGNKYDYSKVKYINSMTKVCIICPIHGEFWMTPNAHLAGHKCNLCSKNNASKKASMTTEQFIKKAREVHGDKYGYSKVEYKNNKTKVCIICPEHGEFWQAPNHHLHGEGCPKCRYVKNIREQSLTTEDFKQRGREIHGDKYDYSKVIYKGYEEKVCIICPEHGEFWQSPDSHLHSSGCPKCGGRYSKAEDEIIENIKSISPSIIINTKNRNILGNGKEIDIFFPEKQVGIEYNGLIWHCDKYNKDKYYHLEKTNICERKGIHLIHVFEDEFRNNEEVVLRLIYKVLGIFNVKKIITDRISIQEISSYDTRVFIKENTLEDFKRATIHFGCYYENKLIGVMSFLQGRLNNNSYKITNFAVTENYDEYSVSQYMFKYFTLQYHPLNVIKYADRRWFSDTCDNIYKSLGFKLVKTLQPDYQYYCKKCGEYRINKCSINEELLKTNNNRQTEIYKIWNCGLIEYKWEST